MNKKHKHYAYLQEEEYDDNSSNSSNDNTQSVSSFNTNTSLLNKNSTLGKSTNKQVQFQLEEIKSGEKRSNTSSFIDDYDGVNDDFDDDDEYNVASNILLDDDQFFKTNYSAQRCIYRLFSYLRPQFWYFIFGLLALSITTLCQLLLPYYFALQIEETMHQVVINRLFIDDPNPNKTIALEQAGLKLNEDFDWFNSSKYLLLIAIVQIPFSFIRYILFTIASFHFVTQLKNDLFRSILTQEVTYFDSSKGSELNAIISSDTLILQNIVSVSLSTLLRSLLQSGGGLLILIFLSWRITLFVFSFVILFFIVYVIFISVIHPKYKYIQELSTRASSVVDSTSTNIAEIRLLNAEPKQLSSFEAEMETVHRAIKSSIFTSGFWIAIGGLTVLVLLIFAFMFTLYETIQREISLFQYVLYALMLSVSVSGVFGVIGEFQKVLPSCRRIFSLVDRRPKVSFKGGVSPTSDVNIVFDNVSFHHKNGSILLSGVSFTINKGTIVSLIGPSQSKDILFSLIQGIYYPTRGCLSIGRVDTRALDLHSFRSKCFSITSNTVIFEGTVEQNIRYGLSHLSQQNIINASKKANLHDFIISLPQGYDTMLGKERLSTIIVQKISVARAWLRDPEVLLVDESSCITESSEELIEPLDQLYMNRTVFVIANRLSTLEKSNQVVVLEDSRVVDVGVHSELIQSDLLYQNLVSKQFPATIPN